MKLCDTGLLGICQAGIQACRDDGNGYKACEQQVQAAAADDCAHKLDSNCNGTLDCSCNAGDVEACDTGKLGACKAGSHTCNADGSGYGTCDSQVQRSTGDDCTNNIDTNCNGTIDCVCKPGDPKVCDTGKVGACQAGTQTCTADGSAYGPCTQTAQPTAADDCTLLVDTTCDGKVSCTCQAGSKKDCTTLNPGACAPGTLTCQTNGSGYGTCTSNIAPGSQIEDCNKVGDEDCDGVACSDPTWNFIAGDQGAAVATDLAVDASGNTFVVGYFTSSITFINKADSTKTTSLITKGGADYFLAKFDLSGNVLWAKSFGDANYNGTSISVAVDASGNVVIGGAFNYAIDFGGGAQGYFYKSVAPGQLFAAKFNSQGAYQWQNLVVGNPMGGSVGKGVAVDGSGNAYLVGSFTGTVPVPTTGNASNSVVASATGSDGIIVKLSAATGASVATATVGVGNLGSTTPGNRRLTRVVVDSANTIYASGDFSGGAMLMQVCPAGLCMWVGPGNIGPGTEGVVLKYDQSLTVTWAQGIADAPLVDSGTGFPSTVTGLATDPSSQLYVAGLVSAGSTFKAAGTTVAAAKVPSLFIANYSPAGLLGNVVLIPASTGGGRIAVDQSKNVYMSGVITESVDFGLGVLNSAKTSDLYVAKFDTTFKPLWSHAWGNAATTVTSGGIGVYRATDPKNIRVVIAAGVAGSGTTPGSLNFSGTAPTVLTAASPAASDVIVGQFQP